MRVVAAVVIAFAATAAAHQDPPQVLRASVEAVRVDVTVTDSRGIFVEGLKADDFEVRDNGRVQPITVFSPGPSPLRLAVLLDVSNSMMRHTGRMRAAAGAVIASLNPDDLAAVGSLMKPGPLRAVHADLRRDLSLLTLGEGSPIWKAIRDAAATLALVPGRRAVLIATDGEDTGDFLRVLGPKTTLPREFQDFYLRQIPTGKDAAGTLDGGIVQLYVLAVPGARINRVLRDLALDSGGRVFTVGERDDVGQLAAGWTHELRQQYILGYAPPEADGELHRIEVRVKRAGLSARTRRTYLAREPM